MRLIAILLFESLLILANPLNKKQSEEWMDSNKIRLNPGEQLTGDVHGNEVHFKRPQEEIVQNQITVWALAVGQGDSTCIICPNNDLVIIDIGSSNTNSSYVLGRTDVHNILVNYLKTYPFSKVRIIITQPDKDHYNYLISALESLESSVDYFILGGDPGQYRDGDFLNWLIIKFPNRVFSINKGEFCFGNTDCKILQFGEGPAITPNFCNSNLVKFTILAANLGSTPNSKSTAIKMQYGDISMLFPGDFASNDAQNSIINRYRGTEALSATIYKMAHHGAASDEHNLYFLNQIKPKAAFASQAYPTSSNDAFPRCAVVRDLIQLGILNDTRAYWFVCGVYHQLPSYDPQWKYQIYETCREPYAACYNIRIQLNQTHYEIDYVPLDNPVVKRSGEW